MMLTQRHQKSYDINTASPIAAVHTSFHNRCCIKRDLQFARRALHSVKRVLYQYSEYQMIWLCIVCQKRCIQQKSKKALHSAKRDLYSIKRALYVVTNTPKSIAIGLHKHWMWVFGDVLFAKQKCLESYTIKNRVLFWPKYMLHKEPYNLSKELHVLPKEPCILSNEPYILSKEHCNLWNAL